LGKHDMRRVGFSAYWRRKAESAKAQVSRPNDQCIDSDGLAENFTDAKTFFVYCEPGAKRRIMDEDDGLAVCEFSRIDTDIACRVQAASGVVECG